MFTLKSKLAECVRNGPSTQHASNSLFFAAQSTLITEEFPPLHGHSLGHSPIVGSPDSGNTSIKALTISLVLQNSVKSGAIVKTTKRLVNKSRTIITGKSTNTKLKYVQVNKSIEIFVSRLSNYRNLYLVVTRYRLR